MSYDDDSGWYIGISGALIVLIVLVYFFTPLPRLITGIFDNIKNIWPIVTIILWDAVAIPISIIWALDVKKKDNKTM
jgi:hypothetical protein